MADRAEIGRRIARQRRRRGLTQAVLAGLVSRSESWLSQVERGLRSVDSHTVLTKLANALGVDVALLTTGDAITAEPKYRPSHAIRDAMLRYDTIAAVVAPGLEVVNDGPGLTALGRELSRVNRLYQQTRYDEAGRLLPGLIVNAEQLSRGCPTSERREALTLRAVAYHAACATLNRVGETELAWTAADRSLAAAEEAERPLLSAVGAYRLGYVLIRLKQAERAQQISERVIRALLGNGKTRAAPQTLSVCGGLYLVAATAAASLFDRRAVDQYLQAATRIAEQLGADRNDFWTAFGPTNVLIHEVSTAVRVGDPGRALSRSELLDTDRLAPELRGRRAQVLLDLARAYAQQRRDAAAVNTLLKAERISPALVRYDPPTGDLLAALLKREHRQSTPQLCGLAHRAGII